MHARHSQQSYLTTTYLWIPLQLYDDWLLYIRIILFVRNGGNASSCWHHSVLGCVLCGDILSHCVPSFPIKRQVAQENSSKSEVHQRDGERRPLRARDQGLWRRHCQRRFCADFCAGIGDDQLHLTRKWKVNEGGGFQYCVESTGAIMRRTKKILQRLWPPFGRRAVGAPYDRKMRRFKYLMSKIFPKWI